MKIRHGKKSPLSLLNRGLAWRGETINGRQNSIQAEATDSVKACPICSGNQLHPLAEVYGYKYKFCIECEHVFVSNPPPDEALKVFYNTLDANGNMAAPSKDLLIDDNYDIRVKEICLPKMNFLLDLLPKENLSWLDVASGVGDLCKAGDMLGMKMLGIEIDPAEVKFAQKHGANVIHSDFSLPNILQNIIKKDVISFISILEHVKDPIKFLGNFISNDLRYVVVEVPRAKSISTMVNYQFNSNVARHMCPPNHLHLFSDQSLLLMLEKFKIKPIGAWYYGQDAKELFDTMQVSKGGSHPYFELSDDFLDDLQVLIDRKGLSDEVLMICEVL
jgi:2-polyprenyl-3-methyl-5-hydroxy-6-metoxy-1,4-benzoquinol methylase